MKGITLYHGDCLVEMDKIEDRTVDTIIADLPYGTTACRWDTRIPFEPLWAQYKRIIKKRGAIVLFGSQPFTSALVMSNPKWYRHEWIWDKKFAGNFANAKRQPMKTHENIIVFGYPSVNYYPQMIKRDAPIKGGGMTDSRSTVFGKDSAFIALKKVYGYKYPTSIIFLPRPLGKKQLHPTQKPVALIEYLIQTYANPGELVLDNTMGSGTTGEACINTGRQFIGIELDKEYFDIAEKRIEKAYSESNRK